jgi:hypothetical protein
LRLGMDYLTWEFMPIISATNSSVNEVDSHRAKGKPVDFDLRVYRSYVYQSP